MLKENTDLMETPKKVWRASNESSERKSLHEVIITSRGGIIQLNNC